MARRSDGLVLRQLRTLFNLGVIGELTDGQLLERFATDGGEAAELAFAALVERHGPMVLRVCRGVLRDPHDAEDAFQATFLVLVRRARSLWVEDSLGPWLHRVACRIARAGAGERGPPARVASGARPRPGRRWPRTPTDDDGLMALLHEEIDRLPERYRVPVVLCDLEGLTHEQAARHLGWPVGTVKSRLTSGRERLRDRLVRRGVAPAIAAMKLMMATTARSASAAVPAGLVEATVRAAPDRRGRGGHDDGRGGPGDGRPVDGRSTERHVHDPDQVRRCWPADSSPAGPSWSPSRRAGPREAATPARDARATGPVAVESDDPEDDEAVVAREMAGLELGLLEDEVKPAPRAGQHRAPGEDPSGDESPRRVSPSVAKASKHAREAYRARPRGLPGEGPRAGEPPAPGRQGRRAARGPTARHRET